jgi:hypothetical protein
MVFTCRLFDSGDESIEMMLEEMLERAGCDGHAQVLVFGAAPLQNEGPYASDPFR